MQQTADFYHPVKTSVIHAVTRILLLIDHSGGIETVVEKPKSISLLNFEDQQTDDLVSAVTYWAVAISAQVSDNVLGLREQKQPTMK